MAMDNVPWLVEEAGVQHSSSAARTLLWVATGGERGVIGASSMAVVPTSVPGPQVQVKPGGATVPSTYPGAAQESYSLRNRTATNVPIRATGSSGGRTDAIIARVDDTGLTGIHPADVQSYEYAKIQVIEGVASGLTEVDALNLSYPAVLLAKVTLPASTGTVTKAMITDLRHIAVSREETVVFPRALIASDNEGSDLVLNSAQAYPDGEWWPNAGGPANNGAYYIDIPKWATRMQIRAEWLSVLMSPNAGTGGVWVTYGPNAGNTTPSYYTQAFRWDASKNSDTYRTNLFVMQEVSVPAALRGSTQPFVMRGARSAGSTAAGRIKLDALSGVNLEVRFLERPDTDLQAD
jgi:hypothetical protein